MIKKVLVGTDTSAAADLAVDAAAELARTNDAQLVVVYAKPGNGASEAFDPGKAPDAALRFNPMTSSSLRNSPAEQAPWPSCCW